MFVFLIFSLALRLSFDWFIAILTSTPCFRGLPIMDTQPAFDTPVLLVVWRRPHELRQVIKVVRSVALSVFLLLVMALIMNG